MDIWKAFEAYSLYARGLRNYAPLTVAAKRDSLKCFIERTGLRRLEDVTPELAQNYFLKNRVELNWSSSTYVCVHTRLFVFFSWCVKQGYIGANPFTDIEKPKLEYRLPRRLSCRDAELLLHACRKKNYKSAYLRCRAEAILAVMLFTGLRRAEVVALELSHVDLEARVLKVIQGKGGKDRYLPINDELLPVLKRYVKERLKIQTALPNFFMSYQKGKPLGAGGVRRLFKNLRPLTNFDFSPHALRHTFATLMLEGGCDIYTLSRLMGHNKISTTARYLNASTQLLMQSMQKHPLRWS